MLATFEREAPNFRLVETLYGDTMRRISLRELGSADQWVEIVQLNGLRPPYLVNDEADRAAGVLVAGDSIRIPSSAAFTSADTSPDEVFGRDLLLVNGKLQVDGGDLALQTGLANYLQALRNRLTVAKRELGFHPTYGNFAKRLIGRGNGPAVGNLAAFYARSALLEDPRTAEVPRCVATIEGDVLRVDADVVPVSGRLINFSTVV